MPRSPSDQSLDAVISQAIAAVVARTVAAIEKAITSQVAVEVQRSVKPGRAPGRGNALRRAARGEITKWAADPRARRVPNFVIELTGGLDTKKKIVAKYGENAVFEKGKPLPKGKAA